MYNILIDTGDLINFFFIINVAKRSGEEMNQNHTFILIGVGAFQLLLKVKI